LRDHQQTLKPQTRLRDCIASLQMPCTVHVEYAKTSRANPQATDQAALNVLGSFVNMQASSVGPITTTNPQATDEAERPH